ncbi:MAG: hypothetical protein PUE51_06040 [Veillonellaceae bacterium]|nr:hypothetical protein [Veillonellaceae bacterium]
MKLNEKDKLIDLMSEAATDYYTELKTTASEAIWQYFGRFWALADFGMRTGAIEKDDALAILNYAKADVEERLLKEEKELGA